LGRLLSLSRNGTLTPGGAGGRKPAPLAEALASRIAPLALGPKRRACSSFLAAARAGGNGAGMKPENLREQSREMQLSGFGGKQWVGCGGVSEIVLASKHGYPCSC